MNNGLSQIVLISAFAAPLLAAVAMAVLPPTQARRLKHWPGIAAALLSVFAGVVAVVLMRDSGVLLDEPFRVYRWITLTSGESISFSWQLDLLSALFVVVIGVASCLVLAAFGESNFGESFPGRLQVVGVSLLQCCVVLLLLAADWFTLYWFWGLTSVASGILVTLTSRSDFGGPKAIQQVLPIWIANGVMLCGLPLYWEQFATFDLQAVDSAAGGAGQAATWRVWAFGFCMLAGVAARCSLFPLAIDWTQSGKRSAVAIMEPALLLPAGLYLAARALIPLSTAPLAGVVMVAIGAITALVGSVDAAVQPDWQRRLRAVSVGLCGMTILGLGTMSSVGCTAAVCLAAVQAPAMAGLWLASTDAQKRGHAVAVVRWSFAANCLVICSGIWGQHAILSALSAMPEQFTAPPATYVVRVAYWVGMASLPCLSFAMVTAFCGLRLDTKSAQQPASAWLLWISPILTASIAPVLILLPGSGSLDVVSALQLEGVAGVGFGSLPLVDVGLPLVLLGAVAAWLRVSSSGTVALDSTNGVLRWLQTCGGLPEFWTFLVGVPIRIAAGMCRMIDALVLIPTFRVLPRIIWQAPSRVAGSLQTGQVQFYLLSVLLAAALLLFVLTGIRS